MLRAGLLSLALVAAAACGRAGTSASPRVEEGPQAQVTAIAAAELPAFVGVIAPAQAVVVAPEVAGELRAVHVRPGDRVAVGDLIATLDDRAAREHLAMARAELRSAQAAYSQADVAVAQAKRRLRMERKLVAEGISARNAVGDARFAVRSAEAARRRAGAEAAERRPQVDRLARALGDTELRAPFAAVVAARYRDPGALAGPNAPVVRLISGDSTCVRFAVPPDQVQSITVGDRVSVTVEPHAERVGARVTQVAPQLDPAANMIFVEAELDAGAAASIQAGFAASVRLER